MYQPATAAKEGFELGFCSGNYLHGYVHVCI